MCEILAIFVDVVSLPIPFDMTYPPSTTDPSQSATPERTVELNTRGTVINGIQQVMATLQEIFPRRYYPADGDRRPVIDPKGWQRGGTSPGGASLGGDGGNYFVGYPEMVIGNSMPQRIIWEPPGEGEEEWLPNQQVGPFVDPSTSAAPQLLTPQSPATDRVYRQMGISAAAQFATRVIPFKVHIWDNDWTSDELIHWFASAFQMTFNGNLNGTALWGPGGYVQDEKGSRGLHYVLTVRFVAPVHYIYFGERPMQSATLGFDVVDGPLGRHL